VNPAKKIALNTGFLYGNMVITIFISLFSTRLILQALGVEDYGTFALVAGVISMLSFLNSAMSMATQRYLSFYLGAKDINKQKSVYNSSVILHLIIGGLIVIALEILGLFIFNGNLNIPADRISTAKIIYQFMIVSTFFTINAVPYDAAINAHEDLLFEAILGVLESLAKLGIAYWLFYTHVDKLILYGLMIALLTISIRIIKSIFCIRRYEECEFNIRQAVDIKLLKEMFAFAGWNLLATFCNVIKEQGLAIIFNHYIGVVINAAYGIAYQVSGQLSAFSSNINKAFKPQIVSSEGAGDRARMLKLASLTCKLAFFLLAFFSVPLMIEMHYVLHLWLKNIPDYALVFCWLILLNSLVRQLTWGLGIAVNSVGNIRNFQIVSAIFLILNLPIAMLLMMWGYSPYIVLAASVLLDLIVGIIKVFFTKKLAGLNIREFFIYNMLNSVISVGLSAAIALIPHYFMEEGFLRLIITTLVSSLFILFFGKIIGLTNEEENKLSELLSSFIHDIRNTINNKNEKKKP
jgi:O-antigen/teichoic acid export membrane protein